MKHQNISLLSEKLHDVKIFANMLNALRHQRFRADRVMLIPTALHHSKVSNLEVVKVLNALRQHRIESTFNIYLTATKYQKLRGVPN